MQQELSAVMGLYDRKAAGRGGLAYYTVHVLD
jgi:hypothetical protein